MSGTEIIEAVLRLPRDERARVAREILRSLDEGSDEDADAAWLIEIERRMADFDAGGDPGEEWSVVRDRILAGLRKP